MNIRIFAIFVFCLIIFLSNSLFASNLSPVLNQIRENNETVRFAPKRFVKTSAEEEITFVSAILKSRNVQSDYEFLKKIGCVPRAVIGSIITVDITIDSLNDIYNRDSIIYVNERFPKKSRNDKSREASFVDKIHNGIPEFSLYKGSNVIVGIVDTGLDLDHEDFKFPDGKTRVLYLWDQNNRARTGPGGVGRVWNKSQIDANMSNQKDDDGHGTHVAGTAVGNGAANKLYTGMAPEANIIIVNTDWVHILEGVKFIFEQAELLGQPCVVNLSLGYHYGPHDGTDNEDIAYSNLVGNYPGRVIVAAAGNEGSDLIHYRAQADNFENSFTFEPYEYEGNRVEIWFDRNNSFDYLDLKFEVINFYTQESVYTSNFIQLGGSLTINEFSKYELNVVSEVSNPNNQSSNYIISFEMDEFHDLKIHYKGSVLFDAWVASETGEFLEGDTYFTVLSPAVSPNVIAVASYVSKRHWVDINNRVQRQHDAVLHQISDFSSRGPSRNLDRTGPKPDFAAPGEVIISSRSKDFFADSIDRVSASNQNTGNYVKMQGTSMASPAVAGIVALFLEKNPTYTAIEIRDMLRKTANRDDYVLNHGFRQDGIEDWNRTFGFGKVNAYEAILFDVQTVPDIKLFHPFNNMYVNSTEIFVSGKVESFFDVDEVLISINNEQHTVCNINDEGVFGCFITLPDSYGSHTIVVSATDENNDSEILEISVNYVASESISIFNYDTSSPIINIDSSAVVSSVFFGDISTFDVPSSARIVMEGKNNSQVFLSLDFNEREYPFGLIVKTPGDSDLYSIIDNGRSSLETLVSLPEYYASLDTVKKFEWYQGNSFVNDSDIFSNIEIKFSIPDILKSKLNTVFRFNENTNRWVALNENKITRTSDDSSITARLNTFSIYGVFPAGTPVSDNLSNVIVFPNPFRPNDGNTLTGSDFSGSYDAFNQTGVHINGLTENTNIKIFDVSGHLVNEIISFPNQGKAIWDTKNSSGKRVASGVYVLVISNQSGQKKVKKLGIIR